MNEAFRDDLVPGNQGCFLEGWNRLPDNTPSTFWVDSAQEDDGREAYIAFSSPHCPAINEEIVISGEYRGNEFFLFGVWLEQDIRN
jgi:hypothetical protein